MDEILKEVKKVRIWVAILSISVVIIAVSSLVQSLFMVQMYSPYNETMESGYYAKEHRDFRNHATSLIAKGEYEKLMKVSNEKIAESPNDPFGHYYLGLAHYYVQNYQEAITELELAKKLQPDWPENVTKDYLDFARKALGK